jgi:hypothetical protein
VKQPTFRYGSFTLRRVAVLSDWNYAARCSLRPGGSVTGQRIHRALQWRKRNQNRRTFGWKDDFPTEASGCCNGSSTITTDG